MNRNLKSKTVAIIIALSFFTFKPAGAAGIDDVKFHEVEAGSITYALSGFQSGTETLLWEDYGRRTKRHTNSETNFMGMKQKNEQIVFTEGTWLYNFDPAKNTATKMENPALRMFLQSGKTDMIKTGEDIMRAMGAKSVGKDTILGKPCVKWLIEQMAKTTTCIWKGIALKTTSGMQGMAFTHTATAIQTGGISKADVSLPAGTKVVEGPDPAKLMEQFQQGRLPRTPGMGGRPKDGPGNQNPAAMLEQLKKMQEEMQKRGMGGR